MFKSRIAESKINRLLETFPVVAILGPRQCGKSTLAKMSRENWKYFDLENQNTYDQISNDVVLFFKKNTQNIIIDEAQRLPALFARLRGVIDECPNECGRYILTGSASYDLLKNISETLAGRIAIIELSPFKMDEFLDNKLSIFFTIFERVISFNDMDFLLGLKSNKSIKNIEHYLLKGGYPSPVLRNNDDYHSDWFENYFDTYINRDMRIMYPKLDLIKYRRVIAMLSSLSSTIINKTEIARSVEVSEKSVRDYFEIICGTYFWRNLQSYRSPLSKTTVKLPKGHFRDSGLALFLQNIYTTEQLENYPKLGNLFESFVVEEIIRGVQATRARNVNYYHFRTRGGAEIDLILEGSFGILPIEIKYQTYTKSKQLLSLQKFVELHNLPFGIVINNSDSPCMITDKIIQIPIGCL